MEADREQKIFLFYNCLHQKIQFTLTRYIALMKGIKGKEIRDGLNVYTKKSKTQKSDIKSFSDEQNVTKIHS
ncbi:CLUMA_CG007168, isoform A [Clunio marinus]|uniref:CLUMA_CG007168, isoform A n=1 Tax=Clunio marinus TaxID=568069 RepID=A0A1J1I451_9DIPT|nr:CLUMA_CG007168, isoform A [Clunio marinus]